MLTPSLPMSCSSAARLQPAAALGGEAQLLGDQVGEQRDALAVAAGVGALGVDDLREGGGDVVEVVLVDGDARAAPARARTIACCERRRAQRVPELGVARRRARRPRPAPDRTSVPARRCDLATRGLDAAARCGRRRRPAPAARCARRAGCPRPRRPSGWPPPSQCSSRFVDALRDGFGEAHLAGDVGAAVAARLDQLARDLAAVLEDVDDARGSARRGRPSCRCATSTKRSDLRQAAVDRLEVALEGRCRRSR